MRGVPQDALTLEEVVKEDTNDELYQMSETTYCLKSNLRFFFKKRVFFKRRNSHFQLSS